MYKSFLFVLIVFTLCACRKKGYDKFDEAEWHKESYFDLTSQLAGSVYGAALNDSKIVRIQSLAELDSLGPQLAPSLMADFASFDFTQKNLFIALFLYEGQEHETVTRSRISINESGASILIDFKTKTNVGGSAMNHFSSLYFFELPIDKSMYDVSGTIEMNEKSLFQSSQHDFTTSYTLY